MRVRSGASDSRILVCSASLAAAIGAVLCGCAAPHGTPPLTQRAERVQMADGLWADRQRGEVLVDARIATREGWLEQLVCKAGTREHESLLAVAVQPSLIHAALLYVGAQPGTPGSWREEQGEDGAWRIAYTHPSGAPVEVLARVRGASGERDEPLCDWIRGVREEGGKLVEQRFPCDRFVFAGSHVRPNPPSLGPGEHYIADYTGSIVGLVTFGDEMIAFREVIPDRVDLAPAVWTADTARIPPEGSAVQLVIRAAKPPAQ